MEQFIIDLNDNETYVMVVMGEMLFGNITLVYAESEYGGEPMPFTDDYIRDNCLVLY
jgi:hypothetical protein